METAATFRFKSSYTVIVIFTLLTLVGIGLASFIPVKLLPATKSNFISISFNWPKTAAKVIDQEVTAKIEGVVSTVRSIKNMRSETTESRGSVMLEFDDHTDIYKTRYEIATLMRDLYHHFPAGVTYPRITMTDAEDKDDEPIMIYGAEINGESDLRALNQTLIPSLKLINGMGKITVSGKPEHVWEFDYDESRLNSSSVSVDEIDIALKSYFKDFEINGQIPVEAPPGTGVHLVLSADRKGDWALIPVKKVFGRLVRLGELGRLSYVERKPASYHRVNGKKTVNIELMFDKNANIVLTAGKVREMIMKFLQSNSGLPNLILLHNDADQVKSELLTIIERTGLMLTFLITIVLLITKRGVFACLTLVVTAVNLLISFIFYYIFHIEIHLYSLAGISISIGIMLDNAIVAIFHVQQKKDLDILLAVIGSTSTSIGALLVVFLIDDKGFPGMIDFAVVVIINLAVSIVVALFLVPAILSRLPIIQQANKTSIKKTRKVISINGIYKRILLLVHRRRILTFGLIFLLFGLPIELLPLSVKAPGKLAGLYNHTLGAEFFTGRIRPYAEIFLGGMLRPFMVRSAQHDPEPAGRQSGSVLDIYLKMPDGVKIDDMNHTVMRWEDLLGGRPGIRDFQSWVYSGQQARIAITFTDEAEQSGLPFQLKKDLERMADLSGLAEMTIRGAGRSFSNELDENLTKYVLVLSGYNYDRLNGYADRVKGLLEENPRVSNLVVASDEGWGNNRSTASYHLAVNANPTLIKELNDRPGSHDPLRHYSYEGATSIKTELNGSFTDFVLDAVSVNKQYWQRLNAPITDSSTFFRLNDFGPPEKKPVADKIYKDNQEYQLFVNFDFIGDFQLAQESADSLVQKIRPSLPLGYHISKKKFSLIEGIRDRLAWMGLLTVAIVFIICAIMLNSLKKAGAVLSVIPVAYVGVLASSLLFSFDFDEGGYASFVVLTGLATGAPLYILNDYSALLKRFPRRRPLNLFIKAVNFKLLPVTLSRVSVFIALIPYILIGEGDRHFWYALSIGVISGLCLSFLMTFILFALSLPGVFKNNISRL